MIYRDITEKLIYYTGKYPVVTLTGPRQSGKSTLLKNSFPEYKYVSLEDPDILLRIEEDPRLFLQNYPDKTIIDEAQRFPDLFSYLQGHVDNVNKTGMYILSGSHNFLLMEKISQTLAGRTAILKLLPFSYNELGNAKFEFQLADELIHKGSYPRIYDKTLEPDEFYPFYIQTYIERDIRQLKNVSDMNLFLRFVKLCAGRTGQLLNTSALANECGISQPTAGAWLSLLEASFIIYLLRPHFRNFNKRLVKTPKLYFYDSGLACSLLGIKSVEQLNMHYLKGELFENFIIAEHLKNCYNNALDPNIYFWRDNIGNEIDLIIEKGNKTEVVEIKSGLTANDNFFRNLRYWQKLTSTPESLLSVVYGGENSLRMKNGNLVSWKDWTRKKI